MSPALSRVRRPSKARSHYNDVLAGTLVVLLQYLWKLDEFAGSGLAAETIGAAHKSFQYDRGIGVILVNTSCAGLVSGFSLCSCAAKRSRSSVLIYFLHDQ